MRQNRAVKLIVRALQYAWWGAAYLFIPLVFGFYSKEGRREHFDSEVFLVALVCVGAVFPMAYLISLISMDASELREHFAKVREFLSLAWYIGIRLIGYALLALFLFAWALMLFENETGDYEDCDWAVGRSGLVCE